jgi:hypothetical protein
MPVVLPTTSEITSALASFCDPAVTPGYDISAGLLYKRIKADAFIRGPRKDVDGLSVNIQSTTDVPLWLGEFSKSFGADTLHSGRIRMLAGLDVGQAEEDTDQPGHRL